MGKKEEEPKNAIKDRVEAVRQLLSKQAPLTVKQEKFCNDACVDRFLRNKGDSVKRAAKSLRACLTWREAVGADRVMADEFSSELAEGVAYVAGHDHQGRPVMVFRVKQDYSKFHSQKSYVRLVVFTLEVAISTMSRPVDQFVAIFDASFFRSASAFLQLLAPTLKMLADFYPGRLHGAFVVDPPSLFSYLWKGARPFVDLWGSTAIVSSLEYDDDSLGDGGGGRDNGRAIHFRRDEDCSFSSYPRAASLRFDKPLGSTSSRFSFTVSHIDALKPWYLSRSECCPGAVAAAGLQSGPQLIGASPLSARSFSFASPADRSTPHRPWSVVAPRPTACSKSVPSTPAAKAPPPRSEPKPPPQQPPRTPRPSFLQSPAIAAFFGGRRRQQRDEVGEPGKTATERGGRESFPMYLRFIRNPYDEMVYRSKMRPPLGGIVSIVSPHIIRQQRCRHVCHQRF